MNKTLLPKLRFPEFRDAPAWKKTPLEDSVSPVVRQVEKPKNPYTGLGIRSHGKGTFLKPLELPEKNAMEYLYTVQSDDLIVNITFAWEGAIAIVKQGDSGALVSHRFPTYTFNRDIAIPEFFQYVILDKRFIYNLGVISPGGAGRNRVLNKNDFLKLTVSAPDVPEQQKIADCLASLNDLIAAQSQKVEALKAYKKGLMQSLFPAEGESVPRLRFPEFESAGEWEEKTLGQIADIRTGPFGSVLHESDYVEIGTPIITVEHLGEFGITENNVPKVSDSDKSRLGSYQLKEGDIVFSRVGSVDRCSIIRVKEDGWLFSGRLLRLRLKKHEKNSPQFLYQLLKHEPSKVKIRNMAVGQTMPSLNTEILNGISFHFPLFSEQQRIAEFLTSIDEQISAQSETVAALKVHKKGLMQQLFPSS